MTSELGAEDVNARRAADDANIRWLLAAVLHHEPGEPDQAVDGPNGDESPDELEPGHPGGGEIDSSRNGGTQAPSV